MTNEPNRSTDRDPTQPVEVQRYGPVAPDPGPVTWQAAEAWSSRPQRAASAEPPRRGLAALPVVAIAVVAGILSGALSAAAVANLVREPASLPGGSGAEIPGTDNVSDVRIDESSAVIAAVEQVTPAVVTISATGGGFLGTETGTGSGFIFDANGWILTNRHVVENTGDLMVVLNDGREFPGSVYGIDTLTDLAIVKIDATDLPVAPIGTSADLESGQLAIAIGNPLGYENTVTTGVVSGLGREIQAGDGTQSSAETLHNLIQTDAAINPGNSGGPLVNSAGQVIGVNTAVNADAQGLGFAIPIDVAKPIMQQALDGVQPLVRPWIGVSYIPIDPALAAEQDLPVEYGALIGTSTGDGQAIFPGGPAEAAGLQAGDIIVAIDDEQIGPDTDLSMLILPHSPGDTVSLRVLRDDSVQEVEVTLGERPADS
jgi:S1-C subfamily serine protease